MLNQENRLSLHDRFENIIGRGRVKFQPPASYKMTYPHIVYKTSDITGVHANDNLYKANSKYEVVLMDKNPDSPLVKEIMSIPMCRFVRYYASDNINHWVFYIYS